MKIFFVVLFSLIFSATNGSSNPFLEEGAGEMIELVWHEAPLGLKLQASAKKYRPVIIVHGVLDDGHSLDGMISVIQKAHPGTDVAYINVLDGLYSILTPMWTQAHDFYRTVLPVLKSEAAQDGVTILGYSQGGLVARAMIELYDIKVHNFISLSSPQGGQYGANCIGFAEHYFKTRAYELFYTNIAQRHVSISNYWNDPNHQAYYMRYVQFLPYLDNLKNKQKRYHENFSKINHLVLIGGPDDGVIEPWQSSHFATVDTNNTLINYIDRDFYIEDSFGLKTLNLQKKITIFEVPNVQHLEWHKNLLVIQKYILPYLN